MTKIRKMKKAKCREQNVKSSNFFNFVIQIENTTKMSDFIIYNTLNRKKEIFKPLNPGHVGMYVCGPTVYGEAHLGHSRPAITFDLLFRYLKHIGYKVRYVRNITDVGHLVNDADEGEDKIARKAKVEELEPMEIVQMYTNSYRRNMLQLNVLPPSIEPTASGHIIEQIAAILKMIDSGFAYEINGSVYFDVEKYASNHDYGKLSGRKIEDLYSNTRDLDAQNEKKSGLDFALWKKAAPEHIMHWPSPWGEGFPGWHTECTAMSTKYLGEPFDIHGGGLDLLFPHHEAEIAQGVVCFGHEPVRYWMHNNLITINGQKMGKSLGNFITLDELFSGSHLLLEKAYSPICIRFFILQAHYRSPLDFSNEALQAAEKGLDRLFKAINLLKVLEPSATSTIDAAGLKEKCYTAINDDLNTPVLIAHLFDGVKMINSINDAKASASSSDLEILRKLYNDFVFDILGLSAETSINEAENTDVLGNVVDFLLNLRIEAKKNKDWATSDKIRNSLTDLGFEIKDTKEGFEWEFKK
jgi:cysteinyl-tRNA synthetase